jgi:DNA-binding MarR family transcriptional regulator
VGKVTLGGLVDRLENGNLVKRVPDPTDRRAKRVYLTPLAKKILMDMRNAEDEMNERILRGVSAVRRTEVMKALETIKHNLVQITASAQPLEEN